MTRSISRSAAASAPASISYCRPNGRFDTTASASMSPPSTVQPTAAASARIVPVPQKGSSSLPAGVPASDTIAAATAGRSAPVHLLGATVPAGVVRQTATHHPRARAGILAALELGINNGRTEGLNRKARAITSLTDTKCRRP
ncbi:MAG TPA: hypothetical protein VK875_08785 [Euzebyales bacterium]|nr:hypothetical protein [Euzebyales bacterium]